MGSASRSRADVGTTWLEPPAVSGAPVQVQVVGHGVCLVRTMTLGDLVVLRVKGGAMVAGIVSKAPERGH